MYDEPAKWKQVIFGILGITIIVVCVYTDVYSELKFTEDSRNGIYTRMSVGNSTP